LPCSLWVGCYFLALLLTMIRFRTFLILLLLQVVILWQCKHDPFELEEQIQPTDTTDTATDTTDTVIPQDTTTTDSIEIPGPPAGTKFIPSSPQRPGNASDGRDYLVTGDYVSSGIPYNIFTLVNGTDPSNQLNRSGDNSNISYSFTAVDAPNGVRVVAANCLQCHAQELNGELIMGLGNSLADFTTDQSSGISLLDLAVTSTYGNPSPEWTAYQPFRQAVTATGPYIVSEKIGANPADKLATVLAAYRDGESLEWQQQTNWPLETSVIPSDVPAWWLLKKKNAMFATASGKGDFARIMMASGLLTLEDKTQAESIDSHFDDVLAYLLSLTAPAYSGNINTTMAGRGEKVFKANCASCHGYEEYYPNLLVDLDVVGTDPALAEVQQSNAQFTNWYNNSWFASAPNAALMDPEYGYLAPPLDGVWATAPYLHNASVPNLETLLNSSARPTYWTRSGSSSDYDMEAVGWSYTESTSPGGKWTFDTTLPGYGNQGHTFGDALSDEERTALIEYLKTL